MYQLIARSESFVVINKSPGISVHRDDAAQGLVARVEQDLGCKLWLVHRLDRITSGILLLATSARACEQLAALGFATSRWRNTIWPSVTASRRKSRGE